MKLHAFNPDRLPELRAYLAKLSDRALLQLAPAGIKFVSVVARNAATKKGLLS